MNFGLRYSLIGLIIFVFPNLYFYSKFHEESNENSLMGAENVGLSWVPVGYQDTREDGIAAATEDIKNNKMMFAKYGAIEGLNYSKYQDLSIAPILLGCGIGGDGFKFWMAYNKVMVKEMQRRGHNFDVGGPY